MDKEQMAFVLYEQADSEFLAKLLDVDVEEIKDACDDKLLEAIKNKVDNMNDDEIRELSKDFIGV